MWLRVYPSIQFVSSWGSPTFFPVRSFSLDMWIGTSGLVIVTPRYSCAQTKQRECIAIIKAGPRNLIFLLTSKPHDVGFGWGSKSVEVDFHGIAVKEASVCRHCVSCLVGPIFFESVCRNSLRNNSFGVFLYFPLFSSISTFSRCIFFVISSSLAFVSSWVLTIWFNR